MTAAEMVEAHRPLVEWIVTDISKGDPRDRDDMVQDGLIALWQCAQRWDPTRGKFSTFARPRVRGEVIDGIRSRTGHRRSGRAGVRFEPLEPDSTPYQVADPTPGPEAVAIDSDRLARAAAWLDQQDERTRAAVTITAETDRTLTALADEYGVTPSMMSYIRTAARARLQALDAA